jgi:hypothetical protein
MLAERSPEIGKVVGLLKELSMDEQVQIMYEAREKARRDHEARIRFAENEGIALGEARGEIRGDGTENAGDCPKNAKTRYAC